MLTTEQRKRVYRRAIDEVMNPAREEHDLHVCCILEKLVMKDHYFFVPDAQGLVDVERTFPEFWAQMPEKIKTHSAHPKYSKIGPWWRPWWPDGDRQSRSNALYAAIQLCRQKQS